jgi:hypothetical protein
MTKIKLSTGEVARPEYPTRDVMEATLRAFQGFVDTNRVGIGKPFDTGMGFEVGCALAAIMIEGLPAIATPRDMRVMSEDAGDRVLEYMKLYRESFMKSGKRAIEAFGGVEIPTTGSSH